MNIQQLLNTKAGKQLAKDYQTEKDKQRSDLFAQIAMIKEQRNSELPALTRTLEQATSACVEASNKLEAAKISERTAIAKLQQAKASYASQVTRIEKEILASAPECINDFILEIKQDMGDLRNTGITKTLKQSNSISFNARLQAMREIINEAEKLKLLAVPDIQDRLQALRAGLPEIVMQ